MRKLYSRSGLAVSLFAILAGAIFSQPAWAQDAAPVLELPDHTGQLQRLENYRGKIVVLNFWATWCAPCVAEMPIFVDVQKRFGSNGVVVLAASLDAEETKGNIPEFMRRRKMNFPVLVGATADHLQLFGMGEALPGTVFLNRQGQVVSRILGEAKKGHVFDRVEWLLGLRRGKAPAPLLDNAPKPR